MASIKNFLSILLFLLIIFSILFIIPNDLAGNIVSFAYQTSVVIDVGISVVSTEFTGSTTTNFAILSDQELANISNLILENSFGKINFTTITNLTVHEVSNTIDIDSAVDIINASIYINATSFSVLNKSANLTFYGLSFTDPRILIDGVVCDSSICQELDYTNNNLLVSVLYFANFSIDETPVEEEEEEEEGGGGGGGGGAPSGEGEPEAPPEEGAPPEEEEEELPPEEAPDEVVDEVIDEETIVDGDITEDTAYITIDNIYSPVISITVTGTEGYSVGDVIDLKDLPESNSNVTDFQDLFSFKPKRNFSEVTFGLGYICAGPRYAVMKCADWNYDKGICLNESAWEVFRWLPQGLHEINLTLVAKDPGLGVGPSPYAPYCGDGYCDVDENTENCGLDCGITTELSFFERILSWFRTTSTTTGYAVLEQTSDTDECVEDWFCKKWTRYDYRGIRRRACVDNNECGTKIDRPPIRERCPYMQEPIVEVPFKYEFFLRILIFLIFLLIFIFFLIDYTLYKHVKKRRKRKR